MSDIDERLEEEILHAFRKSFDSQQAGINLNFLRDIQREIERLRADLAAANTRMSKLDFERTAAELERDALRAENERMREALSYYAEEDYNGYNGGNARACAALEVMTEPASPWRDIESAPKDGTHIDLWVNSERIPDARWNDRQRRWEVWSLGDYDGMEFVSIAGNPTHWMPLPEPPR